MWEGAARIKDEIRAVAGNRLGKCAAGVIRNGILLYGPQGTGKNLVAEATAGELSFFIGHSSFVICQSLCQRAEVPSWERTLPACCPSLTPGTQDACAPRRTQRKTARENSFQPDKKFVGDMKTTKKRNSHALTLSDPGASIKGLHPMIGEVFVLKVLILAAATAITPLPLAAQAPPDPRLQQIPLDEFEPAIRDQITRARDEAQKRPKEAAAWSKFESRVTRHPASEPHRVLELPIFLRPPGDAARQRKRRAHSLS